MTETQTLSFFVLLATRYGLLFISLPNCRAVDLSLNVLTIVYLDEGLIEGKRMFRRALASRSTDQYHSVVADGEMLKAQQGQ